MKLFETNNIEIIRLCQDHFCFKLPSDLLHARSKFFLENCEFEMLEHSRWPKSLYVSLLFVYYMLSPCLW